MFVLNKKKIKGFTLLEILLVVGIIAVLAGIVILAINPNKMLATARNTQRKANLAEINKALYQYYIDNSRYPTSLTSNLNDICNTGATSTGHGLNCTGLIDLSYLVPTYLTSIPTDPQPTASSTKYKVMRSSNNKPYVSAPQAEQSTTIDIGNGPPVLPSVTYNGAPLYIHPTNNSAGAEWGCTGTAVGASSDSNGQTNTAAIVAGCATAGSAGRICSDLTYGSYDDWYLPAYSQMSAIFTQRASINKGDYTAQWADYTSADYWTSTEYPGSETTMAKNWCFYTGMCITVLDNKPSTLYVRCVRS
jgi:type IV pilus assembly protein PilA